MAKRGPGRPRKEDYDENGNLVSDTPEDETPNETAVASATQDVDVQALLKRIGDLEGRLGQIPKRATPDGTWKRNYRAEEALKVHGGVEVEHPPGFEPLPPSTIPRYVATDGGTTDHADPVYQLIYKYDDTGQPVVDDEGNHLHTKKLIAHGAKKDENGKPVKTEEYKTWMFVRLRGDRLDGNVMSDIAAGKGIPAGAVYEQPDLSAAGIPE